MKKQRKHYTAEEKVAILRRHLLEGVAVSALCDELGLQPTVFYRWQKELFEKRSRSLPEPQGQPPPGRAGTHRISGEKDPAQGPGPGRADGGAHRLKKRTWGALNGAWVPHDTRDQIVDFVRRWSEKTEIGAGRFILWLDITASKFYDWRERYGKMNEHNGWVPRDFWLEDWEKQAIIGFHLKNPLEGYRRLTFMWMPTSWRSARPACGECSARPDY